MALELASRGRAALYAALIAAVLLTVPLAADASTGSSTNIVDPVHSTYKARVSSSGQLSVAVGNTVHVTGNVNVGNAGPAQVYNTACTGQEDGGLSEAKCSVASVPAGKRLVITTATVACDTTTSSAGGIPADITVIQGAAVFHFHVLTQSQGKDIAGDYEFVGNLQGPLYLGSPSSIQLVCNGASALPTVIVQGTLSGYVY